MHTALIANRVASNIEVGEVRAGVLLQRLRQVLAPHVANAIVHELEDAKAGKGLLQKSLR